MNEASVLQSLIARTDDRIQELRRKLEIQEGIRAELQEQLSQHGSGGNGRAGLNGRSTPRRVIHGPAVPAPGKGGNHNPRLPGTEDAPDTWTERVADVMREAGGTMRFGEIVSALMQRGHISLGTHKLGSRVFGVLRRRKSRFEKLGRGEYRLIA